MGGTKLSLYAAHQLVAIPAINAIGDPFYSAYRHEYHEFELLCLRPDFHNDLHKLVPRPPWREIGQVRFPYAKQVPGTSHRILEPHVEDLHGFRSCPG